jgi:mycofactocin precursor
MRTVLLEGPERHEQAPARAAIGLNPIQFSEICHRVLNYRAPYPREERSTALSITPEQLEKTPVEREPEETSAAEQASEQDLVVEDLLIEDVSIDGMCGVY